MKRTPKPAWDDPAESKRFLDEARAAEASDDPKDFDDAVERVIASKSPKPAHS